MSINTEVSNKKALAKLGAAIRKRRKKLSMTQCELSVLARVSVNLLCQVENGKTTTQIGKLLDIISTLGMQFTLENGKERICLSAEFTK